MNLIKDTIVAHHKSAKTRIRRNERKRVTNKNYMANVRTAVKKFRTAIDSLEAGDVKADVVRPLFIGAQSMIAKASSKGLIHANNATRKITRLAVAMKSVDKGDFKEVAAKTTKKKAKKKVAKKKATSKKKK
jgi:small subunit ribosomal protein S20